MQVLLRVFKFIFQLPYVVMSKLLSKILRVGDQCPQVINASQLAQAWGAQIELEDGRWVAARALGFFGYCWGYRLKVAWKVFTGEWDALHWEGGQ